MAEPEGIDGMYFIREVDVSESGSRPTERLEKCAQPKNAFMPTFGRGHSAEILTKE